MTMYKGVKVANKRRMKQTKGEYGGGAHGAILWLESEDVGWCRMERSLAASQTTNQMSDWSWPWMDTEDCKYGDEGRKPGDMEWIRCEMRSGQAELASWRAGLQCWIVPCAWRIKSMSFESGMVTCKVQCDLVLELDFADTDWSDAGRVKWKVKRRQLPLLALASLPLPLSLLSALFGVWIPVLQNCLAINFHFVHFDSPYLIRSGDACQHLNAASLVRSMQTLPGSPWADTCVHPQPCR